MMALLRGIQAVTVELLGVLLVVGMLFGFTAMGLHSVSGQPPTLKSDVSLQLLTWKEQFSNRFFRSASSDDTARKKYVANRLGYFSQTYSLAARNHIDRIVDDLSYPGGPSASH